MRKMIYVFTVVMFLGAVVNAQEKSNTESWYTYWGLGYSSIGYPSSLQNAVDYLLKQDGVSHVSLALDMLGFYWHVAPQTIGGIVVNGVADRFEVNSSWMQINQYIYGLSMIHYPGAAFGRGIFLRTDVGLAKLNVQSSGGGNATSNSGWGLLVGGGWSFDLGGTRLLLNVNYAWRKVEGEAYNTLGFSLGGLF